MEGVALGWVFGSNFQLLMLSRNLLKSQSSIMRRVVPTSNFWCRVQICQNPKVPLLGGWIQLPTFDAEFKSVKIQKSHYGGGGIAGDMWGGVWIQLTTSDAESKSAKIPKSHYGRGERGRGFGSNLELLMLSPNLLKLQSLQLPTFDAESKSAKIQSSIVGGGWIQLPTFDAEPKSAKTPKFYYGKGVFRSNSQLLMLSPNLLKSQSPISVGEGGLRSNFKVLMSTTNLLKSQSSIMVGWVGWMQLPKVNFKLSTLSPKLKFPFPWGGGGRLESNF